MMTINSFLGCLLHGIVFFSANCVASTFGWNDQGQYSYQKMHHLDIHVVGTDIWLKLYGDKAEKDVNDTFIFFLIDQDIVLTHQGFDTGDSWHRVPGLCGGVHSVIGCSARVSDSSRVLVQTCARANFTLPGAAGSTSSLCSESAFNIQHHAKSLYHSIIIQNEEDKREISFAIDKFQSPDSVIEELRISTKKEMGMPDDYDAFFEEFARRDVEQANALRSERRAEIKKHIGNLLEQGLELRLTLGDVPNSRGVPGWIETDLNVIDLLDPSDFDEVLGRPAFGKVDAMLAEHVWEHLSLEEGYFAARNCFSRLKPGGTLRVAVPDPLYHRFNGSDSDITVKYEEAVAYKEELADAIIPEQLVEDVMHGHAVQYSAALLTNVFVSAGFEVQMIEYFMQNGTHFVAPDLRLEKRGLVKRSIGGGDPRGGVSIVLDAVRPLLQTDLSSVDYFEKAGSLMDGNQDIQQILLEHGRSQLFLTAAAAIKDPENVEILYTLGNLLQANGQYTAAMRAFQRALLKSPNDLRVLEGLAEVLALRKGSERGGERNSCSWSISSPSAGQNFEPYERIQIAYDLSQVDPFHIASEYNLLPSEVLGITVCSHLREFQLSNCFPQASISVENTGRKILQPHAYILPHFIPLECSSKEINITVGHDSDVLSSESNEKMEVKDSADADIHPSLEQDTALPFCFITIVLNGMPFIQHHIDVLLGLEERMRKFEKGKSWEWHIVEGIAIGRQDASNPYSTAPLNDYHSAYLSIDGTTAYIDSLAQNHSNVYVHRKFCGGFSCPWKDKIQMINTAVQALQQSCLLVQLDADELWTTEMLMTSHSLFQKSNSPSKDCAYFHCHFYVSDDLVTVTPNGYGHTNQYEWLRMWRFRPGMTFFSHAPPALLEPKDGHWEALIGERCYQHDETEQQGLVFTHYAYATESQLRFKASFYGYQEAVGSWRDLKNQPVPLRLAGVFPWLGLEPRFQDTVADHRNQSPFGKEVPAVHFDQGETWSNPQGLPVVTREKESTLQKLTKKRCDVHIGIDGVIFQMQYGSPKGISRVWQETIPALLHLMNKMEQGHWCMTIFIRGESKPAFLTGLQASSSRVAFKSLSIPIYNEEYDHGSDAVMLSMLCNFHGITAFFSSQYTKPLKTLSPGTKHILLIHDLMPELFGWNMESGFWSSKRISIHEADAIVTVSNSTTERLRQIYPQIQAPISSSMNGINLGVFRPAAQEAVLNFTEFYSLRQPYVMLVGLRMGYKNGLILYNTFRQVDNPPMLLLVGGDSVYGVESQLLEGLEYRHLRLEDSELAVAFSGATALVQLSTEEGFGLPVVEAMACGCPVIASDIPIFREITANDPIQNKGVILSDPTSLIATWHSLRTFLALDPETIKVLSQYLVETASRFGSWNHLASSLIDNI